VIIVSDTSALTNLAAIDHLQLLHQLYGQVLIPEAVYRELTAIVPPVSGAVEVDMNSWLQVKTVSDRGVVERLHNESRLDPGESEAIALALELDADLLLIDERRGRAEANRLGVRITGLLGILIEAKQKGLVEAVKPLMDGLIATSEFRISSALYDQILTMAGEV
jgi:predicted nucleic acid-binding protein